MNSADIHIAKTTSEIEDYAAPIRDSYSGGILLAAIDFSDHSTAALLEACTLADALSAGLIVLHVVNDPGDMPGYYSRLIKKKHATKILALAAESFGQYMDELIAANPALEALPRAHLMMVKGLPVTRILEVVTAMRPRMLLIGSQGRSGLDYLVLGSKAARLVRLCPAPVTVVKNNIPPGPSGSAAS